MSLTMGEVRAATSLVLISRLECVSERGLSIGLRRRSSPSVPPILPEPCEWSEGAYIKA